MDWVLSHIFIVVFAAVAVANMLQRARKAGLQQRPQSPPRGALDAGTAERTRRVQEEIRRKIAERAGRLPAGPPTMPQPPTTATSSPPARNIFQELAQQMAEAKKQVEMRERAQAAAEAQAQQRVEDGQKSRELAEAQHLAEVQRTQQRQQQTVATAFGATAPKTPGANARDKLLAGLREPDSLRRAWVLREILGEPVGLR